MKILIILTLTITITLGGCAREPQLGPPFQSFEEIEPLMIKYFTLSYGKPSELVKPIEDMLTDRGAVFAIDSVNLIMIKDTRTGIHNTEQFINKVEDAGRAKTKARR